MAGISDRMKKGKFKYKDIASINSEIKKQISSFRGGKKKVDFAKIDFKDGGKWVKGPYKPAPESLPRQSVPLTAVYHLVRLCQA